MMSSWAKCDTNWCLKCKLYLEFNDHSNELIFVFFAFCRVNEETFWRNYFYRISLIKQGAALNDALFLKESSSQSLTEESVAEDNKPESVLNDDANVDDCQCEDEKELTKELKEFELINKEEFQLASVDEDEINLELANFTI